MRSSTLLLLLSLLVVLASACSTSSKDPAPGSTDAGLDPGDGAPPPTGGW